MGILGFARSTKLGVAAIVGLGNKADIDEDDLLTFFEQDDNTQCVALHMEDLKDGRSFVEVAQRVSQKKPIVVLKAGRHAGGLEGGRVAHRGAGRRRQGLRRHPAPGRRRPRATACATCSSCARALPVLPTPTGENVVIITGAGGSGVLLSDACYNGGLQLMEMPDDLNEAFMKFIPPFGAAGNPVDITGGEPPETYANTIRLGLEDERIHSLVLGYWHTIITPPMTFAKVVAEVVEEYRAQGDREADRGLARRGRRGRGGLAVPVRARGPRLPVHDGDAGRGARGEVPLGTHGRAAGSQAVSRRPRRRCTKGEGGGDV